MSENVRVYHVEPLV